MPQNISRLLVNVIRKIGKVMLQEKRQSATLGITGRHWAPK